MIYYDLTTVEEYAPYGFDSGALNGIYLERWAVKRRR
jgi:hypothetical protein